MADYEAVFRAIYDGVDYFVVNVSCPNITDLHKLQDQDSLEMILGRILEIREGMKQRKPVLLKISPDLNEKQLDETLEIVSTDEAGRDCCHQYHHHPGRILKPLMKRFRP